MNILVIIPARGGSKGIPRKNLRYLAGKPLLYYVANILKHSRYSLDTYLSSEDDEILSLGVKLGLKVHKRALSIAGDTVTLDPVIYDCLIHAEKTELKKYDFVITMQPTSPLLKAESLDSAIEKITKNNEIDTILSASDTTALSWSKQGEKFIPLYEKRVNRQYLKPTYTETGGFLITKRGVVTPENRIGKYVELYLLGESESIDIDTFQDWAICEYLLKKKKILFIITGNKTVGLGHVYNSLLIANDILNHDIQFLVDKESSMAAEIIARYNYKVILQQNENIVDDVVQIQPDVVINDRLDTTAQYICDLKKHCKKIINFEDLGDGAQYSDLVFNAIYPERESLNNHYYGAQYFLLRDEFLLSPQKKIEKRVSSILLTFGGVDPLNNTLHVLESIYSYCIEKEISIKVIAGFGYDKFATLERFDKVDILKDVKNISDYMLQADIIFTSAGRTIYEIASLAVPCIVLAQNERELTHYFASSENGFLNLGLGNQVSHTMILESFKNLAENFDVRLSSSSHMQKTNFVNGRKTVVSLIKNEIEAQ
ncbi:cytidylyltransferase domain-containing protein [Acinetobacter baumannii]|uniref:cytidylyltransferase domain-containing protein n=1 Tax=Acinetobacter baumannii TaxID=470 RepID=UPI000BFA2E47|nr:acylneuraminate cytidylyltransferase [Acinetobacter baumannii]MDC4991034.1 acylneuraminate cytidylyltransferase [Acinetobacter baumannii]MDC4994396.1 acylneuraminate cytidylyltransferase [Acinetobacter baumannii]MDC5561161.1 acylneuraminate cytidylyltransferase [Acinetobacter baumannii]WCS38192.1 acylneuraminate cytidylyltransferase [Acinetobacter baumannii]